MSLQPVMLAAWYGWQLGAAAYSCFSIKSVVISIICGIILINPTDNLIKLPIILPFQQNQASFDGSDGYPAPLSFQEQWPISVFLSKCWLFQSFAGLF
ncbi:hypothetical protein [Bacillus infantis]|uniref:Uncharacterized protein n=1 Tax=Bacillus infantis TaxID=324767 RepID=A0A5D4RNE7_9BACI|nr:hypothetical protein [Bacillus infantis]TYS51881.1 hypothetical protein FZD51_00025 [Bacillus infantis]